jgi:hypothetical protein
VDGASLEAGPRGASLDPNREPTLVARLDTALPGDGAWRLIDVVDDDTLLVDLPVGHLRQAALVDVSTGTRTPIGKRFAGGIHDADVNARFVTWVTSNAPDLFTFPWELYVYDRGSGRAWKLAEAPDVGVDPVPAAPNGTSPTLHGGRVYLTAVRRVLKSGRPVPAIYSVPVTGGRMRLELAGDEAYDVVATEQALYYEKSDFAFYDWVLMRKPFSGGPPVEIASGGPRNRFSGKTVSEKAVVWTEYVEHGNTSHCTIRMLAAGETVPAVVKEGNCDNGFAYYPHASKDFFAYARETDHSGYVVRLYLTDGPEQIPFTFGPTMSSVVGEGRTIAWTGVRKGRATDVFVARLPDPQP